jgi:hypothetical protein
MTTREVGGYGIVERGTATTLVAQCAERIRLVGYAVLPTDLSSTTVADLGERLDRVIDRQELEFGGAERMAAIGDTLTARCPLLYDEAFLSLATRPEVLALATLATIVLMQQNGVINRPNRAHAAVVSP